MARKVKCPECGSYNDKENTVECKGRYYCPICYENKQKEANDYKQLMSYICELYQIEAPTGWILKQVKDFKEQFHYSYKGMRTTLNYFYEIEGNDPADSLGVGIIPFVYDEAKKFYIDRLAVKESAMDAAKSNIRKTININKKVKSSDYRDIALIDIENI